MMRLGNQRFKYLIALIATQVGLLAVGFWIFHRFVVSAVSRAAEDAAVVELTAEVDQVLSAVARSQGPDRAIDAADWRQLRESVQAKPTVLGLRWTVVDPQWRVLAVLHHPDADTATPRPAEKVLPWMRPPAASAGNAGRVCGLLATPDGRHVAVARLLEGGQGYVVADRPLVGVKLTAATLTGLLAIAALIAWIWTSVLMTIAVYTMVARFYDQLTEKRTRDQTAALKRLQSLVRTRDAVIFGLAKLAESRDEMTGHHLERISAYASRLASTMLHYPKYRGLVTPEFVRLIGISSALHDIGKVGIRDSVLLKNGPLTPDERKHVEQHASIGGKCLLEIEQRLGTSNFLQMAREIALSHHERWDGSGYPEGLVGKEIPLAGRIVAIADVYDALSTRRPYKAAFAHEQCVEIICYEAGKQFDPDLVAIFLKIEGAFQQIGRQYTHETTASDPASGSLVPEEAWPYRDDFSLAKAATGGD